MVRVASTVLKLIVFLILDQMALVLTYAVHRYSKIYILIETAIKWVNRAA